MGNNNSFSRFKKIYFQLNMQKFLVIFLFALVPFCANSQNAKNEKDSLLLLLQKTFLVIEQNSVYRSAVDWDSLKAQVFDQPETIRTKEDLIPRVQLIFETIGDRHGAFYLNDKRIGEKLPEIHVRESLIDPFGNGKIPIKTKIVDKEIGYILIPGNHMKDNISAISQAIQDSLCLLNPRRLKGIIVDLRLNEGGSIYPLFTGLHQLIGDGAFGAFTDLNGKQNDQWRLKKGKYYQYNRIVASVKSKCSCPKNLKIAVLISQITASAGEDLAVALKGRPNTIFIGEKTYGFTTGIATSRVDGNLLAIASSFVADRTGKIYKNGVPPDVEIVEGDDFEHLSKDKKINEAIKWIRQ